MSDPPAVESPCIDDCRLNDDGYCVGCRRSVDEIARWGQLSPPERHRIMQQLTTRKIESNSHD